MEKRHLVVGVAMFVASLALSGLVPITAASPAVDGGIATSAETAPNMGVTAAASPLILPAATAQFSEAFASMSDATMLFVAGVALFGLAAGVRRGTC